MTATGLSPSPVIPFDGEVWQVEVALNAPDPWRTVTFTIPVVVERLSDAELTPQRMGAQRDGVHAAIVDQLRPFLNNQTHVAVGGEHVTALADIPVVKRQST